MKKIKQTRKSKQILHIKKDGSREVEQIINYLPRAATELIELATVGEDDEGNLSITEN